MPKARKKPTKSLGKRFHIYCEGEKTEPLYLAAYVSHKYPPSKKFPIIEVEKTNKNTPTQLVDVAVDHKKRKEIPKGDEFWVVYDRENTVKYPDVLHAAAYKKAKDNGVGVAISNVCFEIWILLHFQKSNKPFMNFDELNSDKSFKKHLNVIGISDYEKSCPNLFDLVKHRLESAISNASDMNKASRQSAAQGRENPYQLNPYTGIVELLGAMEEFINS